MYTLIAFRALFNWVCIESGSSLIRSCSRTQRLKFVFSLANSHVSESNETLIGRISPSTIDFHLNLCARTTHVGANFIGTRPPVTSGSIGKGADACEAAPAVACGFPTQQSQNLI